MFVSHPDRHLGMGAAAFLKPTVDAYRASSTCKTHGNGHETVINFKVKAYGGTPLSKLEGDITAKYVLDGNHNAVLRLVIKACKSLVRCLSMNLFSKTTVDSLTFAAYN